MRVSKNGKEKAILLLLPRLDAQLSAMGYVSCATIMMPTLRSLTAGLFFFPFLILRTYKLCRHLAMCRDCADLIMADSKECPLCRTRIVTESRLLRIFKT